MVEETTGVSPRPVEGTVMRCENCGNEYGKPANDSADWTTCCSRECNGAARLIEAGFTITQAFDCASPEVVARMIRNVFDMYEFKAGLRKLAMVQLERLSSHNAELTGG